MWYDCVNMGGVRLLPLLVMVLILYLIYVFFTKNRGKERFSGSLDTLKSRYARGEIGKDEYETIKKDIL